MLVVVRKGQGNNMFDLIFTIVCVLGTFSWLLIPDGAKDGVL